ncbi:MAG: hypothetical protein P8P99_04005 [Maricaulis sp.]|nr:hypothetical protein [Maricaulis sp.]
MHRLPQIHSDIRDRDFESKEQEIESAEAGLTSTAMVMFGLAGIFALIICASIVYDLFFA